MFVVKISKEKQLLDVKHYIVFQNTLADIANGNVFENISDELFDTLDNSKITSHSFCEKSNIADDFEFKYSNGVVVYLGEICPVDNSIK